MTTIELARLLIADKDQTNLIFTDDEIQYMIDKNTVHMVVEADVVDTAGVLYQYADYEFISDVKVFNPETEEEITDFTPYLNKRTVQLATPPNTNSVYVEGDVLDLDNLRADAMEAIVVDFRKLENYSIQNVNGNLETAKEHLLRLARYFRKPKMKTQW